MSKAKIKGDQSKVEFIFNYKFHVTGVGDPPSSDGPGFCSVIREGKNIVLTRGIKVGDKPLYETARGWEGFDVSLYSRSGDLVRCWHIFEYDTIQDLGFSDLDASAPGSIVLESVSFVNVKLMQ
jgi:hypothetical protein